MSATEGVEGVETPNEPAPETPAPTDGPSTDEPPLEPKTEDSSKTAVVQPQQRLDLDSKPVNVVQPVRAEIPEVKEEADAAKQEADPQAGAANPLATLAAEALKSGPAPTDGDDGLIHSSEPPKMTNGPWLSVGIFGGMNCKVTGFTAQDLAEELRSAHFDITKMPAGSVDESVVQKLEPGEFYRFRVRAFNSCGFSPWSEVTTFRTTVPGFPSPPSGVKITATKDGVHLSWQPPQDQTLEILEYSVYLAVRGDVPADGLNYAKSTGSSMAFKRVYIGAASSCLVPSAVLTDAQLTTGVNAAGQPTKPAILFRIAARNKKGYGPSIQVRWIQGEPPSSGSTAARRPAEEADAGSAKKKKKD